MSDKKIKGTLAIIRDNQRRLDGCAGHDFSSIGDGSNALALFGIAVYVRCTHCGGEIEAEAASWYERGIEHGRRKPSRR